MGKLVYGVGVNNANYAVKSYESINGKQVPIWICPYYVKWTSMLMRCYSEKYKLKYPTYVGCSVIPEWHYFMNFRSWMEKQDWGGKCLDKDILSSGNKVYGPGTCVFVSQEVNKFLNENGSAKGEWPIGVSFKISHGKFVAQCKEVISGKYKHLGYFDNPLTAHKSWLAFKLEQAKILAGQQVDVRVAKALIERYATYQ